MRPTPPPENPTIADLTLFELGTWGHFPFYMRLLFESWRDHGTGYLRAIITNRFLTQHPFVFEGFENAPGQSVRWVTLDDADERSIYALRASAEAAARASSKDSAHEPEGILMFYWSLVEKYGRRFPTRHILLMNLDEYLFAIGSGRRAPAHFSGIFFRPDFYYSSEHAESLKRRAFHAFQEQLVLRLLNHPQLRVAFFIDPWVAKSLQGKGTAQVFCLKEPVRIPERLPTLAERHEIRARLGVPADRKLFLLVGDISGRKGIWKLLEAIAKLKPQEAARTCVAIIGKSNASVERRLAPEIEAVVEATQAVIIRKDQYVDEGELGEWFTAADVVLAPYIHHVGMSGILLLASAHRKPVISANLGAMARLTNGYRLGLTVDPRDPTELAHAMASFIGENPPSAWNPDAAYVFAEERAADKFGERLLDALQPFLG